MSLADGTRLGAYEIRSLLGSGGMGEVYRARDTHLKREGVHARYYRITRIRDCCTYYDVSPDGQRFLMVKGTKAPARAASSSSRTGRPSSRRACR